MYMQSLTGTIWTISERGAGVPLIEHIMHVRGIVDPARFLEPSLRELHDPQLLKDMPKAVERIQLAIQNTERVFVVGDYDVDGVVGSAILFKALQSLGAHVSVRLPHRMRDGYGLNVNMIEEAAAKEVGLIVTVDNGISAAPALERAVELGIDVIVTDHHLPPPELPPAFAIINPRQADCDYPFQGVSGAAVGWKLALALGDYPKELADEMLALAAIGTIADVCPLTDENRAIVHFGLLAVPHIQHAGLQRLLANCEIEQAVTAEDVGYRIGPRLNAAGRLESALTAFQALTHPTAGEHFADELDQLNIRRRDLGVSMLEDALDRIDDPGNSPILIASSPDWYRGVIGLSAGRLAERYFRPAIVMEHDTEKDVFVGSCRCPVPAFNITEALQSCADLLTNFGGHRAAAGFTCPAANRAEFEKRITKIAEEKLKEIELSPKIQIDAELDETELNLKTLQEIQKLQPFGAGNPEPIFVVRNVALSDLRAVGRKEDHLAGRVGAAKIKMIGFGLGELLPQLANKKSADLAVTLAEDNWQGKKGLQLKIIDII